MPRRLNLRGFLCQDILLRRKQALLPSTDSRKSDPKREPGTTFHLGSRLPSNFLPIEDADGETGKGVDSIFGEAIFTKKEILQRKVEQFLDEDRQNGDTDVKQPQNPELDKLKEELNAFVIREIEASPEQRMLIRVQKSDFISEIGRLEAKDRSEKVRRHKATSDEIATLPEPIGLAEKKRLQLKKDRATKAALGIEGRHRKRKHEDDDYELDGEERLRAGIKHKELPISGRWYSRIHDYFPEPKNGVDGAGVLEDLTAEERQTMRRELAEYGEKLAKTARKIKALKNKGALGGF